MPLGEFYKAATAAVTRVHPGIGVDFTVLTAQIKESLMRDRLMAALAGAFGLLAGSLAVLGLYLAAQRRLEKTATKSALISCMQTNKAAVRTWPIAVT
jgi:hypothetical protein